MVILIWAVTGPCSAILGHMAARHQHRDHDHHVSCGVRDPDHAEPRSEALHLKLDELIRAVHGARDEFITVEHETEEELADPGSRDGGIVEGVAERRGILTQGGSEARCARDKAVRPPLGRDVAASAAEVGPSLLSPRCNSASVERGYLCRPFPETGVAPVNEKDRTIRPRRVTMLAHSSHVWPRPRL